MKTTFLRNRISGLILAIAVSLFSAEARAQWTAVGTDGFDPTGNLWEHIFFDSVNTAYVSFANAHGQVMKYTDTGWAFISGPDITSSTASDSWSAMDGSGNIYFSYSHGSDSSKEAVVKYNGTSWSAIGSHLSVGAATRSNVVTSSTGTVYVSYIDNSTTPGSLYVQQYVAGLWSVVGGLPVTASGADFPSLAIDHHDSLYIAYDDADATKRIIVKKFNGSTWVMLDTPFSARPSGENIDITLAMDQSNVPYVAYMSTDTTLPGVCVSKYDGAHWNTVGMASFAQSSSTFLSFSIDHSNVPYVAYPDNTNGSKASVMKFNGINWEILGTAGFSANPVIYTSITTDENNNPYVAYLEVSNGGTAVMKYPVCTPSARAVVSSSDTLVCKGTAVTFTATGSLNDASKWYWYTGSCAGTAIDSGTTLTVTPADTTTYYVHGYGGCVLSTPCNNITINVDSVATPSISVSGHLLTSSAATGNQWYKGDSIISAATSATYSVTVTGWYKVKDTNSGGCSASSDSVFISVTDGIANVTWNSSIQVYPSPFSDLTNVDFSNNQPTWSDARIYITDELGRKVYEQATLVQHNILSLKGLPSGIYILNLVAPGYSQVLKITKQ